MKILLLTLQQNRSTSITITHVTVFQKGKISKIFYDKG